MTLTTLVTTLGCKTPVYELRPSYLIQVEEALEKAEVLLSCTEILAEGCE